MAVILTCDRVGCGESESAEGFHPRPGFDDDAIIGVPDGWKIDTNGLDTVMHCPEHADVKEVG